MDEIDCNLLALHSYNHGEEDPVQGHAGAALGTEWQAGLWEAGFRTKGVRCLLVPVGECDWLVWVILRAGKALKPATQGWAGIVLGAFDKESCLAEGLYPWEQNGEGNLGYAIRGLFYQMPRHHIILILNVWPRSTNDPLKCWHQFKLRWLRLLKEKNWHLTKRRGPHSEVVVKNMNFRGVPI